MSGELPVSGRKAPRIKGDQAGQYAARNAGTLHTWMNDYSQENNGLEASGPPTGRVQSSEAAANAAKYKGTVGSLLQMKGLSLR